MILFTPNESQTCNLEAVWGQYGLLSLILAYFHSNIKLQLHFWLEAAFRIWGRVYDLKAWEQSQVKNTIVIQYLSENELIWGFRDHIGLYKAKKLQVEIECDNLPRRPCINLLCISYSISWPTFYQYVQIWNIVQSMSANRIICAMCIYKLCLYLVRFSETSWQCHMSKVASVAKSLRILWLNSRYFTDLHYCPLKTLLTKTYQTLSMVHLLI